MGQAIREKLPALIDSDRSHHVVFRQGLDKMLWGKKRKHRIRLRDPSDMYALLSLKWITTKVRLCITGNSPQCYVAAWKGEVFGGEWIHVYV